MLHLRASAWASGPNRIATGLAGLRDWLAGADPGLLRLSLAARGTLSVLLTTTAALAAAHLLAAPPTEFAAGITLSMMGPFLMREPTPAQRRRTLVLLLLPAIGAAVLTTLLHGHGPLGDSVFLVLVFLCVLLQLRSPRGIALGLVAVVVTYVGLYLELPPRTLPVQVLSIVMAAPIVAFACFVAIPMDPAATLRRAVRAVQWRAARTLPAASALAGDAPDAAALAALRRGLHKLNEAALAADDQLALLAPEGREPVRSGLVRLELATARLIGTLRTGKPDPRQQRRLRLHGRRMRQGGAYHMDPAAMPSGDLRAHLVELGHIIHELGRAAAAVTPLRRASMPAGPPGPLNWRVAFRVTLASALAMAGGMALSPNRWFWAVITVYVVFLNARTRGDTIHKGAQRLAGTLLGIGSGLVIALLLAGDPWTEAAALLLSVFGMYYFFLASYVAGIFWVTVMLGLLYGMLGASLETLLVLRLEETVIGAAAAMLVAAFVLPVRTRDQVKRSGRAVLAALAEAVTASRQALAGHAGTPPLEAMRKVDRQVMDLRLALAPLTAGRALTRRSALERPVSDLLDCVDCTRALVVASRGHAESPETLAWAGRIAARLAALAADEVPGPPDAGTETTLPLRQLDDAVEVLAQRIEVGAADGLALEG